MLAPGSPRGRCAPQRNQAHRSNAARCKPPVSIHQSNREFEAKVSVFGTCAAVRKKPRASSPESDGSRKCALRVDQITIAILARKPARRTATPAPRLAGFRIAILGDRSAFARRRTSFREAEFLGRQVVLGNLLLDVGDSLRDLLFASRRDFLVKLFELSGQLLVRGHDEMLPLIVADRHADAIRPKNAGKRKPVIVRRLN